MATRPDCRRRGLLRKITGEHFRMMQEIKTWPIAILHAAHAEIYQRYGYGIVATRYNCGIDPRYIRFSHSLPITGQCRELQGEPYDILSDIYRKFRADRTGYLHRARMLWQAVVLSPAPKNQAKAWVVYEEDGQALGYVVYTLWLDPARDATEPPQRIRIWDMAWLTPSACQALWSYFASMDLVRVVHYRAPADDPLPHMLLEPRMLRATAWDGLLGRIVDVEQALPKRCYDVEGEFVFELIDDFCPWNEGRWKLETSDCGARVTRTDIGADLVMPVSTLNLVAFGQISASEAARMGRLEVLKPETLPLWDRAMRTRYRPFCPDDF